MTASWSFTPRPERRRVGLTLVELLVVLVILAVLTTLAVSLTDTTLEQARFDVTQKTLDTIQTALVGTGNPTDPVAGYVADMGGLPAKLDDLIATQLPTGSLAGYGPRSVGVVGIPDIYGGWRGPYIQVGAGATALQNGWGEPLYVSQTGWTENPPLTSAAPLSDTLPLLSVKSPGRNTGYYTADAVKEFPLVQRLGLLRLSITPPKDKVFPDGVAPTASAFYYYGADNSIKAVPSVPVSTSPVLVMLDIANVPIGNRMLAITPGGGVTAVYPYPVRVTGGLQTVSLTMDLTAPAPVPPPVTP